MPDFTVLNAVLSQAALTPSDPGFSSEVAGFNTAIVHAPDAVVTATTPQDVLETVRFAHEHGLPVRVQATGHGALVPANDGILINTSGLDTLSIDPQTRIATIGAGVRWSAVVEQASPLGLAPIAGSSTNVGVVGLVTGGGLGPLSRSHGFASDYVRGFTVVTGQGELVEATAEENPDLFWALRGGKGGLGIVTEVRVQLVELSELYAGTLFFEEQHIEQALRAWVDWTADAAPEVTTSAGVFRLPPFPFIPEPLRGRTLLAIHFARPGTPSDGERLAQPLRDAAPVYLDYLGLLPASQIATIHNDPTEPGPGWDRGMLLSSIDQDFVTALLANVGSGVELPMLLAEVRHLGEATRRDVPGGSAVGGRESGYSFTLIGAPNPALFEEVLPATADRVVAAIEPWLSSETNINFAGRTRSLQHFASAWPADVFARLASVRLQYDSDHIFPYGPPAG